MIYSVVTLDIILIVIALIDIKHHCDQKLILYKLTNEQELEQKAVEVGVIESENESPPSAESFCAKLWRWTKYILLMKAMNGSSVYEKINMVQNQSTIYYNYV